MPKIQLPFKSDLDLREKKIENLQDNPSNDGDAANKKYVDSKVHDGIRDGETTTAPSENAVNDALGDKLSLTGQSSQTIDGSIDISGGSLDIYDGSQDIFRVSQDSRNVTIYDGDLNINNGNITVSGTVDGIDVSALPDAIAAKQDALVGYSADTGYDVGDIVYSAGELFICTQAYTSPHSQAAPQNQPTHWRSVTTHVEVIDTLQALMDLNKVTDDGAGNDTTVRATISVGELFAIYNDTDDNNGLYRVTSTGTTGTEVKKLTGSGGVTLTNLPTVAGDVEALPPGPVIYDQTNNRYFVESNADFGVWSPYDAYQVNDRVYFDNILFQCVIAVPASAAGQNLSPSSDVFIKTQPPGTTPIPIPGLTDQEAADFGALNPSWILRRGLVQEFVAGAEYLKDSIVLFDHFGNKQQYKMLYSVQSTDTTEDTNTPERKAYQLPGYDPNDDDDDTNVWYEHYVGGDNGVGNAQIFEFPSVYPGDLMTPAETSGWFIPVGSQWHHNGSIWNFEGPTKTSFPDGTLYNITRDAFTTGVSPIIDPERLDDDGNALQARHYPPNAYSSLWSEEHEDLSWSPYSVYTQNHSIALYKSTGDDDAKLYLRTGATTAYNSALTQDEINLLTPDVNAGWTEVSGGGGGVTVVTAFPDPPTLGEQIFLNVSVSHSDGTHNRPRGFYTYVQPSSNPTSRYWEELTISEVGQLFNNARVGDIIYLENAETNFNTTGNNFEPGLYRAAGNVGDDNHTTWTSIGGSSGGSVKVNTTTVSAPDFKAHPPVGAEPDYLYSPAFQIDNTNDVSVQIDQRELLPALQAEVAQIAEELSNPGDYTWAEETTYQDVFLNQRTNETGTSATDLVLQSHFETNYNVFTTYALLTGSPSSGQRLAWGNARSNNTIVGYGPDEDDLIAFQLISSIFRDTTAINLLELKLRMIDPEGAFTGQSGASGDTNRSKFESWRTQGLGTNPVIHSGIATYYYSVDNPFLETVRHNLGTHFSGSSLTAAERVVVDSLTGVAVADNATEFVQVSSTGTLTSDFASQQTVWIGTGVPSTHFDSHTDVNNVRAGDLYINTASTHVYTKLNDGAADDSGNWSGASTVIANTTSNLNGLTVTPDIPGAPTSLTVSSPNNTSIVIQANPDADSDFSVSVEDVRFNESSISGVTTLAGDTENGGVVATGVATINGAPINALEKLGYFLGTPGETANGTVPIGLPPGTPTEVPYTPYTTTQNGIPYIRYFYSTIRIDTDGSLTTVAGDGLGIWSNKILDMDNTDGTGYINLIG